MKKSKIYDKNWRKLRRIGLMEEPLCFFCKKMGKLVRATVRDHVIPIRDNPAGRLDSDNLQSLCKPCHDSIKQKMEQSDFSPIGEDGFPISKDHPWNRGGE